MNKDLQLLEQAYVMMYESTSNRILVPRRNTEERKAKYLRMHQRLVHDYIQNGSQGHLSLRYSDIDSLPDGLTVNGYLFLDHTTNLTKLPSKLHVKGSLDLVSSAVTSLPDDLVVEGGIYINYTKIAALPANMREINGDLFASWTPLSALPDNLHIKGDLKLEKTNIRAIPSGLKVDGIADFWGSPIEHVPTNMKTGKHLTLKDTPFAKEFRAMKEEDIARKWPGIKKVGYFMYTWPGVKKIVL